MQVDWDNPTLGVFYSSNNLKLTAVAGVLQNPTVSLSSSGQGDFLRHRVDKDVLEFPAQNKCAGIRAMRNHTCACFSNFYQLRLFLVLMRSSFLLRVLLD